ncbi:hypothetical protein MLD38_022463 [Melastoma candidum]|uniref:Uncharacterized protein n=1 Tax=Melastoma candidum TaxID=119954 RepID=A0ACB9QKC3_9MYRT|nr:hypothetical protein MLD38_022463 [Melastoma candidum]
MKQDLQFPAGFRFHPTDEELVTHYLVRKCASQPIAAPVVAEIDLYKFDPWDLPDRAPYGENEWYFFSPRDRKYPNGSRPNRAAGSGYWKATGADKPIGKPRTVGIKKALVFYAGKSPKGNKTNWIMHEYRLADVDRSAGKKKGLRLDDWVLCRIHNKKGVIEKPRQQPLPPPPLRLLTSLPAEAEEKKLQPLLMVPSHLPSAPTLPKAGLSTHDSIYFDNSESPPKLHPDSSCSEHAASPGFTPEVQSEPDHWEKFCDGYNELDPDFAQTWSLGEGSPQDIFMYLQELF